MAAPSTILEAVVVVDSSRNSHRLMVDRIGVCNFVFEMGGAVRMVQQGAAAYSAS